MNEVVFSYLDAWIIFTRHLLQLITVVPMEPTGSPTTTQVNKTGTIPVYHAPWASSVPTGRNRLVRWDSTARLGPLRLKCVVQGTTVRGDQITQCNAKPGSITQPMQVSTVQHVCLARRATTVFPRALIVPQDLASPGFTVPEVQPHPLLMTELWGIYAHLVIIVQEDRDSRFLAPRASLIRPPSVRYVKFAQQILHAQKDQFTLLNAILKMPLYSWSVPYVQVNTCMFYCTVVN